MDAIERVGTVEQLVVAASPAGTAEGSPAGMAAGDAGLPVRLGEEAAVGLGRRLQGLAGASARLDHEFCTVVAAFDAGQGIGWYRGLKTTAHFLAWACAMTPAVAREHVRVARALRQMPITDAAFASGALSYSKVRELTRLAGACDEAALVELALELTASQLARTVASYRTCAGTRLTAGLKRSYTMTTCGDGMVRLSVCLPAEDAAILTAAVEAATRRTTPDSTDRAGTGGANTGGEGGGTADTDRADTGGAGGAAVGGGVPAGTSTGAATVAGGVPAGTSDVADRPLLGAPPPPRIDQVQALVDVAACYLDTLPGDPADDHTLVIVHVNAELLTHDLPTRTPDSHETDPATTTPPATGNVPAGTREQDRDAPAGTREQDRDVPAGTPEYHPDVPAGTSGRLSGVDRAWDVLARGTCYIENHGPLEAATAARLACTSQLVGALIDRHGHVLALGRTTRLANRAQRRALRIRDHGICQFPGCHQTRHVEAHHLLPWKQGGPTDLDNLILLCRAHHTLIHEGGITITPTPVSTISISPATGSISPATGSFEGTSTGSRNGTANSDRTATGDGTLTGDRRANSDGTANGDGLRWPQRWQFLLPDGQPINNTWRADTTPDHLTWHLATTNSSRDGKPEASNPDAPDGHDDTHIGARHGGEGFHLHECVNALFQLQLPDSNAA